MKFTETFTANAGVGDLSKNQSISVELDGISLDSEFMLNWVKARIDRHIKAHGDIPEDTAP